MVNVRGSVAVAETLLGMRNMIAIEWSTQVLYCVVYLQSWSTCSSTRSLDPTRYDVDSTEDSLQSNLQRASNSSAQDGTYCAVFSNVFPMPACLIKEILGPGLAKGREIGASRPSLQRHRLELGK